MAFYWLLVRTLMYVDISLPCKSSNVSSCWPHGLLRVLTSKQNQALNNCELKCRRGSFYSTNMPNDRLFIRSQNATWLTANRSTITSPGRKKTHRERVLEVALSSPAVLWGDCKVVEFWKIVRDPACHFLSKLNLFIFLAL